MQEQRLLISLIIMVGLLSVIAIVVSAVSFSRTASAQPAVNVFSSEYTRNAAAPQSSSSQQPIVMSYGGGASSFGNRRVFTIAVGHDNGAHEYFDDRGYLQGFGLTLINEVCDSIHIDCRIIWDKYSRCWSSNPGEHSHGGEGLLAGWYDACAGWAPTVERLHVFSFSEPYFKPEKAYFYTKSGGFVNPLDITAKKIGFIDGSASDEKCLARHTDVTGRIKPTNQILYASTAEQLSTYLKDGLVDVGMALDSLMSKYVNDGSVKRINTKSFTCMVGGAAIMTRKDSDFAAWWNAGFSKIKSNGRFGSVCEASKKIHGLQGDINCIDTFY